MLSRNGFRWQVSRPFVSRTGEVTNTVWKSLSIAPRNSVSWSTTYALNWSLTPLVEDTGRIRVNGPWQACKLGAAYDLDQFGFWKPSVVPGRPGHMMVGVNHFSDPDNDAGIYIVIGQRVDSKGEWEPVSSHAPIGATRMMLTVTQDLY